MSVIEKVRPLSGNERRWLTDRIASEAGRQSGFVVVSKSTAEPTSYGFSFLAVQSPVRASVHGRIGEDGEASDLETALSADYGHAEYDTFVMDYLERAASRIGVDKDGFARTFYAKMSIWRFEGYVDGVESRAPDNGSVWRPLWPKIIRFVDSGRLRTEFPDDKVHHTLATRLRSCGVEGQIVLDR